MTSPVNPLRSGNKLKFGAFSLNGDSNRRTTPPEHYRFNWENSLDVAVQADLAGFEVVVPYARWRSLAAPKHFASYVFDATTWAGAVAARTRQVGLMTTIHVTTVHPMIAAKMMSTVDHVSNGRFALNIVCGWFEAEMKMFGQKLLPHDERYAYADEWITSIKQLWTAEDPIDFNGKYIQIEQGICFPQPLQKPHPLLMNAGASADGRAFVAKHCEMAFIPGQSFETMKADAAGYRQYVRDTSNRKIQIWTPCAIIQGETMAEAQALAETYVAHADPLFLEKAFQPGSPYAGDLKYGADELAARKRQFTLSGGNYLIVGDAQHIAREMQRVSEAGIDGLLLTWVEPQSGIRMFREKVMPILAEAGLRGRQKELVG